MVRKGLVVAGALALGLVRIEDARACSCMGPHDTFVGPAGDDVPIGAVVRVAVPTRSSHAPAAVVVGEVGGSKVDAGVRSWPDGQLTVIELRPTARLKPTTRYEVAVVDPKAYPSTRVFGTFQTGAGEDRTAPKLDAIGTAVAKVNAHPNGGSCGIAGPWIEIGPVHAEDPGRPNAQLMFAVWAADAAGHIDTAKPPQALVQPYQGTITLGRSSLCDPHDFPIPKAPFLALAIAAIDESGNLSPARKLRVDLRSAVPP
jgi:hypothetical protein